MAPVITLVVEASTYAGSAALLRDGVLVAERAVAMRGREHEALMPAVGELYAEAGVDPMATGRVVCGAGPGSFTSLRIAGGIAKGIAMGAGAPLVPVSSLALLVASMSPARDGRFVALLDAMRGEFYAAAFDVTGGVISPAGALAVVSAGDVEALAASVGGIVVGPDRTAADQCVPRAGGAARITNMLDSTAPADLASWEPAYGRLAEAQVKWEAEHGRPLPA